VKVKVNTKVKVKVMVTTKRKTYRLSSKVARFAFCEEMAAPGYHPKQAARAWDRRQAARGRYTHRSRRCGRAPAVRPFHHREAPEALSHEAPSGSRGFRLASKPAQGDHEGGYGMLQHGEKFTQRGRESAENFLTVLRKKMRPSPFSVL
jgi:hypothetical protein